MSPRAVASVAVWAWLLPGVLWAQGTRTTELSLRDVARPVAVSPGGEVVVRGVVRSSYDGSTLDALTNTPGTEPGPSPVPGGVYDASGGGWRVVSRNLAGHAYRLAATGEPGALCVQAGVASPCLPLRLLPLAQSRLQSVADFAGSLSGAMTLEVLDPASVASIPAPPAPVAWAALPGALALAGAWAMRRRAARPVPSERVVRREAARVRARLVAGDPVHRALVPSVDRLVDDARSLAALRDALRTRVARADREGVAARARVLAAASDPDAATTRALVDEQLTRIDRWTRDAQVAEARITQIAEYLRTLGHRLTDATGASSASGALGAVPHAEALAEVERDVESALEAAREADDIVPSGT